MEDPLSPEENTNPTEETQEPQNSEGPKVFDEEYVKSLRAENAKLRIRARDNESAATKLKEIEDSQKTELEKAQEANQELMAERERLAKQLLVSQIQARFKISDDDAKLFLTAPDEEGLTKQAEALTQRIAGRSSSREGGNPAVDINDPYIKQVRQMMGRA